MPLLRKKKEHKLPRFESLKAEDQKRVERTTRMMTRQAILTMDQDINRKAQNEQVMRFELRDFGTDMGLSPADISDFYKASKLYGLKRVQENIQKGNFDSNALSVRRRAWNLFFDNKKWESLKKESPAGFFTRLFKSRNSWRDIQKQLFPKKGRFIRMLSDYGPFFIVAWGWRLLCLPLGLPARKIERWRARKEIKESIRDMEKDFEKDRKAGKTPKLEMYLAYFADLDKSDPKNPKKMPDEWKKLRAIQSREKAAFGQWKKSQPAD